MRRAQRWMLGTLVAGLAAFALLALDDALRGPIYHLDARVNDAVGTWEAAGFPAAAVGAALSQPGNPWVLTPVIGALAVWMWVRGERALGAWAAGIGLATSLVLVGLKSIFERARPPLAGIAPHGYSFPSGHTLGATAALGSAILLATETHRRRRGAGPHRLTVRRLWAVSLGCAAGLGLLTGVGRILLHAHWMSDVLASWSLGVALAGGILLALSRAAPAGEKGPQVPPPKP